METNVSSKNQGIKLKCIIERTQSGYSASEENESIFTTGVTLQHVKDNFIEAANVYGEELGWPIITKDDIEYVIDEGEQFGYPEGSKGN